MERNFTPDSLFLEPLYHTPIAIGLNIQPVPRIDVTYFYTPFEYSNPTCHAKEIKEGCCKRHTQLGLKIKDDIALYKKIWIEKFSEQIEISFTDTDLSILHENIYRMFLSFERLIKQHSLKKNSLDLIIEYLDYCLSHFGEKGVGSGVFMNLVFEEFNSYRKFNVKGHVHHSLLKFMTDYYSTLNGFSSSKSYKEAWLHAMPSFAKLNNESTYALVDLYELLDYTNTFGTFKKRRALTPKRIFEVLNKKMGEILLDKENLQSLYPENEYKQAIAELWIDTKKRLLFNQEYSEIQQALGQLNTFASIEKSRSSISDQKIEFRNNLLKLPNSNRNKLKSMELALLCVWTGTSIESVSPEEIKSLFQIENNKAYSRLHRDYSDLKHKTDRIASTGNKVNDTIKFNSMSAVFNLLTQPEHIETALEEIMEFSHNISS